MELEIQQLHTVWEQNKRAKQRTELHPLSLEEIIGSVFSAGPSYHYIIDFFDMKLSHVSHSIQEIHGLDPDTVTFNDILHLIHPEDMEFVCLVEAKLNALFEKEIDRKELRKYKASYSFRLKAANNEYKLFLHQALVLTMDENLGFSKALNIHTDISHITSENNYKLSLIGLMGEPSYLNIDPLPNPSLVKPQPPFFTKREKEIIQLLSAGLTNLEIANTLFISHNTVKNHRKNIFHKADCKNMGQLIAKCVKESWI